MERKEFIKTCGYGCLATTAIGVLLQSCVATKNISASILGENIVVPKSEFIKKDEFLEYVVVRNKQLQFPIYVYRYANNDYAAVYLQCTHQGNEVSAYGDKLVCSAHGSEYDSKGNVTMGPATESLRSFPVQIENQNILISLKKV